MAKLNCWQVKNCGREIGGNKSSELGVCSAAIDTSYNGIHDGKNGGRSCWIIAGTLCGGKVQGTFAQKWRNCFECEFYKQVKNEEGNNAMQAADILKKVG